MNELSKYESVSYKIFETSKSNNKLIIINPGIANTINRKNVNSNAYFEWSEHFTKLGYTVILATPYLYIDVWKREAKERLNKKLHDIYFNYSKDLYELLQSREEKEIILIGYSLGTFVNGYLDFRFNHSVKVINIAPVVISNYESWMFSNNSWYKQMLKYNLSDKSIEKLKKKSKKSKIKIPQYINGTDTLNLIPEFDDRIKEFTTSGEVIILKDRTHTLHKNSLKTDKLDHKNFWDNELLKHISNFISE